MEEGNLEEDKQKEVKSGHAAENHARLPFGIALTKREDVVEMCMNIGNEEDARHASSNKHTKPTERVRRHQAEYRHGHEDAESVAVDAEDVNEILPGAIVAQQKPKRDRDQRHVRVYHRARKCELVEVVRPLELVSIGDENKEGGKVACDGHRENKRRRDPKGPIQIRVGRYEIEENAARPR